MCRGAVVALAYLGGSNFGGDFCFVSILKTQRLVIVENV